MNALGIALDSIWTHRLRSALTALGIVIGVFAVVTLTSLGAGVRSYVTSQFKSFGATLVTVTPAMPGATATGHPGRFHGPPQNVPSTLTVGDVNAILGRHSSAIARVVPVAVLPLPVSTTPGGYSGLSVLGTDQAYFSAEQLAFSSGKFSGNGIVLGHAAAATLFPHVGNPTGRTLYLGKTVLTVSGVLKSTTGLTNAANQTVFMPVASGLKLADLNNISQIVVQAADNQSVNQAATVLTQVLDQRHPVHDFAVTKDSQMLTTINNTLSTITVFLSGLAAISLLVGGIGIMNIMLVTVTERFKEIGIRKSLGARDGDILIQFLAESV
ncbi:MAG: ABC transporter permease, partial [Sulfobacillus sp.]